MKRRRFLKGIGLALSALTVQCCAASSGEVISDTRSPNVLCSEKDGTDKNRETISPNIIILLTDDLGWGDLGCYGNPIIKTPNLDGLADSGMRLTQFHSAGAICSPSRASLLTGKSTYRLGFYKLAGGKIRLEPKEITIPELLKQKQYATFFAGKWHMSNLKAGNTPDVHGFDYYLTGGLGRSGKTATTKNPTFVRNGEPVEKTEGYSCDLIVDEAINWIGNTTNSKQPFFMEICFREPHTPVTPPEEYAKRYEGKEVDRLAKTLGYGGISRWNGKYKGYVNESNFSQKKYYYGIVEQMDAAVGNLIKYLKRSGLFENTIVIFTSDNGPEYPGLGYGLDPTRNRCWGSPGPYRGVKRRIYEGGTTVPGIICWPDTIKPGQICETPTSSVDLLSTLCKVAGVNVPHQTELDGTDISLLFENPKGIIHRDVPLYWNTTHWGIPNMSMKYDGFTIVASFTLPSNPDAGCVAWIKEAKLHHFEVYNIQSDIKQQHDLYPGNEEKYQYLVQKMVALWERVQKESPEWPGFRPWKRLKHLKKTGYDVHNF
ncbi:MAG: sulfatase-like hydrolase/transferase [Planctomycetota bacterium]